MCMSAFCFFGSLNGYFAVFRWGEACDFPECGGESASGVETDSLADGFGGIISIRGVVVDAAACLVDADGIDVGLEVGAEYFVDDVAHIPGIAADGLREAGEGEVSGERCFGAGHHLVDFGSEPVADVGLHYLPRRGGICVGIGRL